jgi:hypothetical protein
VEVAQVRGSGRWGASWGPAGEGNALRLMVAFRLDGHDSGRWMRWLMSLFCQEVLVKVGTVQVQLPMGAPQGGT